MSAHELALVQELGSYAHDPVGFATDILNLKPDPWQCRFLEAVAEHQQVAVRSSTGQGKDFIAAVAVLWFLASFDYAICPCTANSKDQLEFVLWKQFAELIGGSNGYDVMFEWNATTIRHRGYPANWFAYAKTSAKKVSRASGEKHAEGSAGAHSENMLILMDEASGVEEEFWQAYEFTLSQKNNKIVAIGNPNRLSGSFYQIWHDRKVFAFWKRFTIAGRDLPSGGAAIIPGDELHISSRGDQGGRHSYLISKYGQRHQVVQSKVYGVHPTSRIENAAYAYEEVMAARVQARVTPDPEEDQVQIGCDVAREGDDETVYFIRRGRHFKMLAERHRTVDRIVDTIWNLADDEPDATDTSGQPLIVVDETGVGGGIVDGLRRKGLKRVRGVHFGGGARQPKLYRNLAAEMWLEDLKNYFRCVICACFFEVHEEGIARIPGEDTLCTRYSPRLQLPDNPNDSENDLLMHQLINRTYGFTGKGDGDSKTKIGQRFIESKKDMKARGVGSPDRADALCLAVVQPRVARIL